MRLITDSSFHTNKSVLVLGMFDGVHIGHQVLIQKGLALSQKKKVPLIVSTFSNHPLEIIAPNKRPAVLTTLDEKAEIMEGLGVDALFVQEFSTEIMNIAPEVFIGLLVRRFHPTDVVCGYNYTFGKNGEGTPAYLEAVGRALGFSTWIVPKITLKGEEVSSTAIREKLSEGLPAKAARLLGRFYSYQGSLEQNRFVPADENKLLLPKGSYWCTVSKKNGLFPCCLKVEIDGSMGILPAGLPEGGCKLLVLSRAKNKAC